MVRRCWLVKNGGTRINFRKKVVGQGQRVLEFADASCILAERNCCGVEANAWFATGARRVRHARGVAGVELS